ncbi:hypothetical protein SAMN04515671_2615 [Nakamurella panacisegetis]|uniref:Uncharacterized protein n=1 Tax=Nakamurella panacisegetis TaxID=1090615 RepID=A0A1H0P4B5_9ACTN|nr:hypothetical protein SAMN04515671_2615 [Nakamurella panacisegetis]
MNGTTYDGAVRSRRWAAGAAAWTVVFVVLAYAVFGTSSLTSVDFPTPD